MITKILLVTFKSIIYLPIVVGGVIVSFFLLPALFYLFRADWKDRFSYCIRFLTVSPYKEIKQIFQQKDFAHLIAKPPMMNNEGADISRFKKESH